MVNEHKDRRRHPRHKVFGNVLLILRDSLLEVFDISASGIFLKCLVSAINPPPIFTEISLLNLAHGTFIDRLPCRVVDSSVEGVIGISTLILGFRLEIQKSFYEYLKMKI